MQFVPVESYQTVVPAQVYRTVEGIIRSSLSGNVIKSRRHHMIRVVGMVWRFHHKVSNFTVGRFVDGYVIEQGYRFEDCPPSK